MQMPYHLRPMTSDDLEAVRTWRNHPTVRASMFTDHVITPEEHAAYFDRALKDPKKRYLICSDVAGADYGLGGLVGIDTAHGTADWGFYRNDRPGEHAGTWLGLLLLDEAFASLGLEKVSAEVLDGNTRSLRFHDRLGFVQEGVFRCHHLKDGVRYDVFRLALFRHDWQQFRPHVLARLTGAPPPEPTILTVGHRIVRAVADHADPSIRDLIDTVAGALEGLATPGSSLHIRRLDANQGHGVEPLHANQLTMHVRRRRGSNLTVAFEMTREPTANPLLTGYADLTLVEDPK